jgi:Sugar phosphate permease
MVNNTINEENIIKKLMIKIIPFIMLLFITAIVDRVNVGFAALQMNKALGVSSSMYGLISGIFFISYFICEVPSNVIMHKVGARRWIARILITWGIVTIIIGFAKTPTQLGVLRFLLGAAEAGFYPAIILYLTYWFPSRFMAKAVATFMVAQAIANIVVGPISASILDNVHWAGLAGWRWLFILEGIPAIIFGLITIFVLVDRPDQAKFLTSEEKEWILSELKAELQLKTDETKVSKWAVLKQPRVWHLAFAFFCYVSANYGLGLWLPQIIKGLSSVLTNTQIGFVSTLPYICGAIAMFVNGRHSDKVMERRKHVGLPIIVTFFGLIALTMTRNMWLALFFVCCSTSGMYAFVGTFWTLPTAFLGEATAAVGIATINAFANLGGFGGPYLVGWLKDITGSTNAGMYVLASFALIGSILVLLIPEDVEKVAVKRAANIN